MTAFYADAEVVFNPDKLRQAQQREQEIGQSAVVSIGLGESPLMMWVEWLAGVENAHYFLFDYEDEVHALFAAMHQQLLDITRVVCSNQQPDMVMMVENTSTTLISPDQFRTYCCKHLRAYSQIAHANGVPMILHQCGALKDLLPIIATELPLISGTEAFTSPPVGATRFQDGRAAMQNYCMIGGTNATLWTKPAATIIAELEKDLAALPHHRGLVVTSAGVMPPLAEPETIREVAEWVRAYPARW